MAPGSSDRITVPPAPTRMEKREHRLGGHTFRINIKGTRRMLCVGIAGDGQDVGIRHEGVG
eukprot:4347-Eustigmatos_ZCMA.PRE.1